MDVGNIISFVIPDTQDENINIEQLTNEFRHQLERIKMLSRASKVEHGLATLRRLLPELSREQKRKTFPLIRRVLNGGKRTSDHSKQMRNRMPDARMDQIKEDAQYFRSRLTGIDDKKVYHEYDESTNRDDYRRTNDRIYPNRREDFIRPDDQIRRLDQTRRDHQISQQDFPDRSDHLHQDDPIRREESNNREDRPIISEEDQQFPKMPHSSSTQECRSRNWEYQFREDEHQRDQIDNTPARIPNVYSEDPNSDYSKVYQRYPVLKADGINNGRLNAKDMRIFEPDVVTNVNYSSFDMNPVFNPNCGHTKGNNSGEFVKVTECINDTLRTKNIQHQKFVNFKLSDYKESAKMIQDKDKKLEPVTAASLKNIATKRIDDYTAKRKRDRSNTEDLGKSDISNRFNFGKLWAAIYNDHRSKNSSTEVKNSASFFHIFGNRIVPALSYIKT